jgi:hypothetical protein
MRTFIRPALLVFILLLGMSLPVAAQVSVSIGFNIRSYPDMVVVPGYPVYYAPQLAANFFFYDGLYWVFADDGWYSSAWYDGPWDYVAPEYVPYYVLRVPVRYYRRPPLYFRTWLAAAPPRWGEHWGRNWELRRAGWDRWDRAAVTRPAPLPVYQRSYAGDRYPSPDRQRALMVQHYNYRPVDTLVRAKFAPPPARPAVNPQRSARTELAQRPVPERAATPWQPPREHPAPPAPVRNEARRPQPEPAAQPQRSNRAQSVEPRDAPPADHGAESTRHKAHDEGRRQDHDGDR